MAFEHEPGKITIFRNDQKGNDKAPNYRGKGKLELQGGGTMKVELSLWINETKDGDKYFGGSINEDTYVPQQQVADTVDAAPFDDGIPF